jgi:RNA recognition motif-containing protein
MASNKGKGLAAAIKADPNFLSASQATTESSYDGKTGGGVSLRDYPDPSSPPAQKMAPFEEYAAKQRAESSQAFSASQGHKDKQDSPQGNKQSNQSSRNTYTDNSKGNKKQQGKSAMKGNDYTPVPPFISTPTYAPTTANGPAQSNVYRPPPVVNNARKPARQSVSFAGANGRGDYGDAPSDASAQTQVQYSSAYAPFSPIQGNSRIPYHNEQPSAFETYRDSHRNQGTLTGSASTGGQTAWGTQASSVVNTPHTGTATVAYETPNNFGTSYSTQQQSKTVPRSFAPHQGLNGHSNESLPPPVFDVGAGVPGTPAGYNSMSAYLGLATATPHGSAVVSSSQLMPLHHQSYARSTFTTYNGQTMGPNQSYTSTALAQVNSQGIMASAAEEETHQQPAALVRQTIEAPLRTWLALQADQLKCLHTASPKLRELTHTRTGKPDLNAGMNNFPFVFSFEQASPAEYGVVRIKNIPYTTTKAEILAMLGRNAKLAKDLEEPVHIIMDKTTSKTQDAFVEFATLDDAVKAVERHDDLVHKRRQPRLGQRPVELELSSQAALMGAIFPFAHGIRWQGATPAIEMNYNDDMPWKTFKGFITEEEMTIMVRFVEVPQRVSLGFESRPLLRRLN